MIPDFNRNLTASSQGSLVVFNAVFQVTIMDKCDLQNLDKIYDINVVILKRLCIKVAMTAVSMAVLLLQVNRILSLVQYCGRYLQYFLTFVVGLNIVEYYTQKIITQWYKLSRKCSQNRTEVIFPLNLTVRCLVLLEARIVG